jgi:hypothetical protein
MIKSKKVYKSNKNKVSKKINDKLKRKNLKLKNTKKGGCKWNFLDSDDVWERMNGIISGRIYNIMQYYGLTDANTCIQMEKLGKKIKSKKEISDLGGLTEIANGALTNAFTGYILYDSTKNIKNSSVKNENKSDIDSSSFLIGKVKIIGDKVVFYQHESDKKENENLIFETDLNRSVYVKVIPDKHKKYKDIDKVTKEIFFFTLKDAEWSTIKPGLRLPTNYINDIQKKLRESRKITESQQTILTQGQIREKQVQSNVIYVGNNKPQKGGDKSIYTIPNNGKDDKTSSQCIWIAIRDYLDYHLGEKYKIAGLKTMVGIKPDDNSEYGLEKPESRGIIERLCNELHIQLNFIFTNDKGIVDETKSFESRATVRFTSSQEYENKTTRVNIPDRVGRDTRHVYIATFGNHFELITRGPGKYILHKATKSLDKSDKYVPKIKITDTYVDQSDLTSHDEQELAKYKIDLINTNLDIKYFQDEISLPSSNLNSNSLRTALIDLLEKKTTLESVIQALSATFGANTNA